MRLSDWPSLRLVIPLIAGIILSDTILNTRAQVPVWYALAIIPVLVLLIFVFGDRMPRLSGLCLSLSFVCAGAFCYLVQMDKVNVEWPGHWKIYNGVINSYPLERERTYRLEVTLTDSLYRGRNLYVYLPKDSSSQSLRPGDKIVFDGKINKPSSEGAGFDYASYLLSHGISGTLRVQSKDWNSEPVHDKISIRNRCVRFRHDIINRYREWGLRDNALAVVSAVTLGERKQLDDGLRQVYSSSGVSHVLAVSGLHVGIMCWFLYLLFPSFMFRKKEWVRQVVVMGVLWTYAFAIGLPVSITRTLIMFSIVALCRAVERESSALNSFGIAAIIMLAVNPSAIFDMSFQLSFSAVFFIIILTPLIMDLYSPRSAPGFYLWRVSVLSFAAQIGTSPIIMFHFSSFSTYVLIANLFVVPVMFFIVALSMSLWITGWMPPLRDLTVNVLTWTVDTLTSALSGITSLPYSNLSLSISRGWHILVFYAVVILICLWIKEARSRRLIQALACMALASILGLCQSFVV